MKSRLMFPFLLVLSGCVTVAIPPTVPVLPAVVSQTIVEVECKPYVPPHRERIPKEPQIEEDNREYVKYLEELAESLVMHVVSLRKYIQDEHELEDRALRRHLDGCPLSSM